MESGSTLLKSFGCILCDPCLSTVILSAEASMKMTVDLKEFLLWFEECFRLDIGWGIKISIHLLLLYTPLIWKGEFLQQIPWNSKMLFGAYVQFDQCAPFTLRMKVKSIVLIVCMTLIHDKAFSSLVVVPTMIVGMHLRSPTAYKHFAGACRWKFWINRSSTQCSENTFLQKCIVFEKTRKKKKRILSEKLLLVLFFLSNFWRQKLETAEFFTWKKSETLREMNKFKSQNELETG